MLCISILKNKNTFFINIEKKFGNILNFGFKIIKASVLHIYEELQF